MTFSLEWWFNNSLILFNVSMKEDKFYVYAGLKKWNNICAKNNKLNLAWSLILTKLKSKGLASWISKQNQIIFKRRPEDMQI